ncbi:FecR family protein [Bacteroides sp.]
MKYTETEAERILERLITSTRSPRGRFSAKESYELLKKRLPNQKSRTFRIEKRHIFAAAAAVILLCAMGWMVYNYMAPVSMQTVSTLAECKTIQLPDGTEVTLNHFSSLTYPERFHEKERKVTLNGEGYFEVSKDKKHPFIVQAEAVKVRVLGTHFNIEAYRNDPEVKTTLFEGSVAVSTADNPKSIVLRPNESAIYNKEKGSLTLEMKKNVSDEIAWRNGTFIFSHLPLQEIVRELSNSFGVKIKIENATLLNYRLTARFTDGESLEEILHLLQQGRDFEYKQTDKGIIIN